MRKLSPFTVTSLCDARHSWESGELSNSHGKNTALESAAAESPLRWTGEGARPHTYGCGTSLRWTAGGGRPHEIPRNGLVSLMADR